MMFPESIDELIKIALWLIITLLVIRGCSRRRKPDADRDPG